MVGSITDCAILNNGVPMPWLGLGVWRMKDGPEVEVAVRAALETGYRSIDTAAAYGNEVGVGKGIQASNVPREQIFVTTKVWNSDHGYGTTLKAFDESRGKLGLDTIDLYLIHWPVKGRYKETWRAMEKLYADGAVRAIGVSNFHIHHLEDLLGDCEVKPTVNQVECHPYLTQEALRRFCSDNQVQLEAWSPLVEGRALADPTIVDISKRYDKTPAQILIRWDLQHQVVTVPKSRHRHRIVENSQVFDFELADDDMALIDGLNKNRRVGPEPDNFNF